MELTKILLNLPKIIKEVIKRTLKIIMIAEREVFLKGNGGIKNGFYTRNFNTLLGKLEDLKIPRDREENFKTKLIESYKRRNISLDELIFGIFARGMSARAIAQTFEIIF
ncbi:MAG: Transposase, partial [Thermodesulfobacterium sp.]|nr:Transposase [Candidatus Thermodesulfobacterium syntrophicum]